MAHLRIKIEDEDSGSSIEIKYEDCPIDITKIAELIRREVEFAEIVHQSSLDDEDWDEDDEDDVVGPIPLFEYGSDVERTRQEMRDELDGADFDDDAY